MRIEDAIACLREAGYRVSKPRQRQTLSPDGRPATRAWPPQRDERYVGPWPPAWRMLGVYRPKPLRCTGLAKPLPPDWPARTAKLVFFMSQEARAEQLQAAE
jgi:hypothetical protein